MNLDLLNGIEDRFLDAMQRAHQAYIDNGPRSNKKLKILHGWIRAELENVLGDEYTIMSLSETVGDSKEKQVQGKYYPKYVDIHLSRGDTDIGVISVKFINSSFIKNANNYIESQMGETANLRETNIVFAHLFCITQPVPKYENNNQGNKICSHIEGIRDYDIEKYNTLVNEDPKPSHAPDVQGICIAKLDIAIGQNYRTATIPRLATPADLSQLSAANRAIISNQMDIKTFFRHFVQKVDAKYNELCLDP